MSNFCGYSNKEEKIYNEKNITDMNEKINFSKSTLKTLYMEDTFALASDVQPMSKIVNDKEYIITFNGTIYNADELKKELITLGYHFDTKSEEEIFLYCYIEYGEKCLHFFNGVYSFCIYNKTENLVFLGRDRLGVKPLFYYFDDSIFLFATRIKAILAHPSICPVLDKEGLMELIGLGPAHTPGKTYFKNILELKAGHYATLSNFKLKLTKYWDLTTKEFEDTPEETIEQIHNLVVSATKTEMTDTTCSMLSGGLDSSILSKIATDNKPNLTTFSIDYIGNDTNFVSNDYQLTKDSDYVKIMKDYLKTNHKTILIDNSSLYDLLQKSMIARDMPGMADIDTAMLAFCNSIKEHGYNTCLSGECSDEIFGGYPWYYKDHLVSHDGFPWALSEKLRSNIINPDIISKDSLNEYVTKARIDTLKDVVHLDYNDDYEKRFRNINYLTLKWFMNTLIERTERMSGCANLEVRIPFADYRIFEYVYNIPARMKLGLNKNTAPIEKYLLRKAFENELPEDIVYRKKSPFPKTYDPKYLKLVEDKMGEILENTTLKIHRIINVGFVKEMLHTHGENLTENWFGQLMTYPQTLAYLIQISDWLEIYHIHFDF
ncbi:MAG: asparagine synthase (glutamine-hydrolyzing) [Clostridia bacterium]|nr:asparagine synthase (glutamine-hydrolyzing) [Clostridia bacterium]